MRDSTKNTLKYFVAVALLGLAIIIAGCDGSTVNTKKAEGLIKKGIVELGVPAVTSVSCPSEVAIKKGGIFTCSVNGADGTKAPVSVTQKDSQGNVEYNLRIVDERHVEGAINTFAQKKAKQAVRSVNCPDIVALRKGSKYPCLITAVSGATAKATVVLENDSGQFGFRITAK